jgi:3-(3-hydroxy-phenyl)propionate hydroxylase
MNSAIADAEAAGTAVALALRAAHPVGAVAAVNMYDRVRRQAAHHNRAAAGAALAHLRAASPSRRAGQELAGRLAPVSPRLGGWLDRAPFGPRGDVRATIGRY